MSAAKRRKGETGPGSGDDLPALPGRRLAAVWFADIVSYSRLTSEDEPAAFRLVQRFQRLARETSAKFGGRLVKFIGDAALAEFGSTEAAVRAALALELAFSSEPQPSGAPAQLRIGVHVGDVMTGPDGDLYGDGVNVAARIQTEAEPGQVLVSEDVWRQLRPNPAYHFASLGERELRGITVRIGVFGVALDDGTSRAARAPAARPAPHGPLASPEGGSPPAAASARAGRRRLVRTGAALAAAAVLAVVGWLGFRPAGDQKGGAAVATGPTTVAILPFRVQGGPEYAYLGDGLVTLLSTSLDGAGNLRTIDPNALLSSADPAADGAHSLSPAEASERVVALGADLYLLGTVVESGGRLRIQASLYRPGAPPALVTPANAEGTDVFALVDDLCRQLVAGRLGGPVDRLSRLAVRTTHSLPALKAYLQGESEFRGARYDEAASAFRRAVQADPSFALAHYRLSAASEWSFHFVEARQAAERAWRLSADLTPRDQRLVAAWHGFVNGEADEAERLYEAVLAEDPYDVEAWSGLGEVRAHYNPVRGRPAGEAVAPFQRVLRFAPNYGEARFHMMEFAARRGDRAAFDSLLAGVDSKSPQALSWRAARAVAWGTPAQADSAVRRMREAEDVVVGIAAVRAGANFGDLGAAAALARLLTAPERPTSWQAAGAVMLAEAELARGDAARAAAELDAAEALERDWSLELRALGALLPPTPADTAELRRVRAELAAWDPGRTTPETAFFFAIHADVHAQLRNYLLALLSQRLGDDAGAERYVRQLSATRGATEARGLREALVSSVAAHRAWARGDASGTLALLAQAPSGAPLERIALSPFFSGALDRYLRGEALRALGRPEEALRWYASLSDGNDVLFWAAAHERQSEVLAGLGRTAEARRHAGLARAIRAGP